MQPERFQTGSAFRRMLVWQKSMILTKSVYQIVKKLPREENFALASQLRRCAVSIPSNIAEGSKRGTKKDFLQFLRISSGSAAELETQLILADEEYGIHEISEVLEKINELQRMLESLMRKL
ncbi:MAG: four helix bundle protein [bacterium]|nr:four helix bundle protein [bacterium]